MTVLGPEALKAYSQSSSLKGAPGMETAQGGPTFGDVLKQAVTTTMESQKTADTQAQALVEGRADLMDVVQAVTNAELTLETAIAVRNKVVQAYEKILQMPI